MSKPSPSIASGPQRVRIIGGLWRGTRLEFPAVKALRPTPDRVRETLFNWLQSAMVDAHCLDLFAGSGALGLEALSRGAASAVFVDQAPAIGRYLQDTLKRLHCSRAQVEVADGMKFIARRRSASAPAFNVVFLDPPFALHGSSQLLPQLFTQLESGNWLAAEAWVYIEAPASHGEPPLPPHWRLHRSGVTGQVGYYLAHYLANRSTPSST